ncbi:MAG: serine hydrolase [Sphingopyxis sp.]|nr:serine hydrolase [Sphingopyxis sp.]
MTAAAAISVATVQLSLSETNAPTAPSPRKFTYSSLPEQPTGIAWPTKKWERAAIGGDVNVRLLNEQLDEIMSSQDPLMGKTNAILLIHKGQIVAERFTNGYTCDRTMFPMSVAKMMGAVMAGVLVRDGHAKLDAPLGLSQWQRNDPRSKITLRNTLNMTTGLGWEEEGDASLIGLAFGEGYEDLASYTALQPLRHKPGSYWQYSDGTPSLVGALALGKVGNNRSEIAKWVREEISTPIGANTTELEFDKKGTWYGSSGVRWSPCDLGKFGLLLMRDGVWNGERILPSGWVNLMRTPSEASLTKPLPPEYPKNAAGEYYGMLTFVMDLMPQSVARPSDDEIPIDAFGHTGWGGVILRIVPSRDVILVVVGVGVNDDYAWLKKQRDFKRLTDAFPKLVANAER